MKSGYVIENLCCAYNGFFKCVKVYNYHFTNEIINTVSGSFEVIGTDENLIGFWKINQLKNK